MWKQLIDHPEACPELFNVN